MPVVEKFFLKWMRSVISFPLHLQKYNLYLHQEVNVSAFLLFLQLVMNYLKTWTIFSPPSLLFTQKMMNNFLCH